MILDLFSGPRGWSEGLRKLGLTDVGIEWDHAACLTAQAAGHPSIRADVAAYPTGPFVGKVEGLIASPPCQAWSMAGKRKGELDRANCYLLGTRMAAGDDSTGWTTWEDERSPLVAQPVRWVRDLRPEWVALEQVPPVVDLWRHFARIFAGWGYSTSVAVLNAADFGVPQTRQRAFLLASRVRQVAPPEPTHTRHGSVDLFGGRSGWVTMADALGWGMTARPSVTLTAGGSRQGGPDPLDGGSGARATVKRERHRGAWVTRRPATTVTGDPRISPPNHHGPGEQVGNAVASSAVREWWEDRPATTVVGSYCPDVIAAPGYRTQTSRQNAEASVRVTVAEASVLQSFRPDYPFDGLSPAPHITEPLSVEDNLALADEFVGDGLKRGVHFVVRGEIGQDGEILQAVVMLDAVDVVHDLLGLRPGDLAMLRGQRSPTKDIAASVDAEVSRLLPALVCVERITVEPPLLPVFGTETARDGFAFAVQARLLRRMTLPWVGGAASPDPLVMHEAQPSGGVFSGAVFDFACAHVSKPTRWAGNSRTKQFEQIGNAVPPLLAAHVIAAVTGLPATDLAIAA